MESTKKSRKKKKIESNVSFKDSIKTKLIFIMILLVAVPLAIAIIISYNNSTNKAQNDALELLKSQANEVELEYSNVINQNVVALSAFANAKSTKDFISNYGTDKQLVSDEEIWNEFDKINESINDGNTSISMCKSSGDQLIRADHKEGSSIADRDYFQDCVSTGKPVVSNLVVSKSTGNRVTNIIVPIFDETGKKVIGTVHRSYNLANLHNFLTEHVSDGYIVDRNAIVVAHAQFEISADDEPLDMSSAEYMTSTESSGLISMDFSGVKTHSSWVKEPVSGFIVAVSKTENDIMVAANKAALIVLIIGAILVVVAIGLSFLIAKNFTSPIYSVENALSGLADGRFKKILVFNNRKDEFGEIVRSTNSVIDRLSSIVASIKNSAMTVTDSSEQLADMTNQIAATTATVSNAVQEIATGAIQQAEEIQSAADNVGKITDAVVGVQNSAENMENLAGKMKKASQTSSKSLHNLQDSSGDMTAKIEEIAKTIAATKDAVTSINESVEGISGIASQTNLLSLNASIEAARAGEAGRGFAVVAEEIRKLADDSDSMAQDIRKQMDVLLKQSEAAVAAANLVKQGNLEQQEAIGGTLESVNGMIEDIDGTVVGVHDIAGGATTCVQSNDVVSDAMSSLSAISEENAASSETTGASVEELSATATTLAISAEELKKIAVKLRTEISFFKDDTAE
ncbi:methyl-accepting chemotaxis sensory transducer with Cache sensor [Acetitomaculum ruminis DSM 5522]|uniref:Methyl-accepting chemotaxis sensory transducer with Cache sensor n=1 Tax=Acetitomaculum ruminis DSM 5522 TaxID=1120918 RepID=A0A1I0UX83_9FIRM|nr:methyl-accepting chemotaxis protein [Acetitomaculum ruminis]SFA68704.1 methyl-accepting chemotaxis sensory transducer with Cache sensor [Acetitomaculum ruminis DSM 5522]